MNKQDLACFKSTLNQFLEDTTATISREDMESLLRKLHRKETTLRRYAVYRCNTGKLPPEAQKLETHIEKQVTEIAKFLGFEVEFNDDPRGYAIRFKLPSKKFNQFDGETWALNW